MDRDTRRRSEVELTAVCVWIPDVAEHLLQGFSRRIASSQLFGGRIMGELFSIHVSGAGGRPNLEVWREVLVRVADIVTAAGEDQ